MKKQKCIRMAMYAVYIFLCCCLTGCSFSFCGLKAGGEEELVFSCKEELSDKSQEQAEELAAKTEETSAEAADQSADEAGEDHAVLDGGKVNVNTAGLEELTALNGIGEGRAKAILEYRDQNGPFAKAEDIMLVSGIKEGIFSKIKDQITVH